VSRYLFFTDRDLGKQFPSVLKNAGLRVERHADYFSPDCPDEVWLQEIGRRRWIAVTHDRRIRYKPNELAAVKRHHVSLLIVIGKLPYPLLAQSFVATRYRIIEFLDQQTPPFIAKVCRPSATELAKRPNAAGTISLWYPNRHPKIP
jgi:hypothetical protein